MQYCYSDFTNCPTNERFTKKKKKEKEKKWFTGPEPHTASHVGFNC